MPAAGGDRIERSAEEKREKAIEILSQEVYRGFGPTLAAEYLAKKHQVQVGRETLRGWMIEAKLWRAKAQAGRKSAYLASAPQPRVGNWCNGIPASTIGWKAAAQSCT